MPIDTKHDSYKLMAEKVERVRDFAAGEYVVKQKAEKYLPKLSGQSKYDYEAYTQRGFLVPAVEPTQKAITGAIMRKPAMFDGGLEFLRENADGSGTDLDQFVALMIGEILLAGGGGYLVEIDQIKSYTKENIINWSKDFIVLAQQYSVVDSRDKFKIETKTEYLELTRDENGYYIQNLWRETNKQFEIVDTFKPTIRGERLTDLPFVFVGMGQDPILLHLASVNLDQYRMSTDQRHGLHWTALPTLFLFGDLTDESGNRKTVTIGAGSSNHIGDTDARAELLEFTGAGLGALKLAIDDNIKTMASIGAVMLTNGEQGGVKAAETARIEASSETATLSTIANMVDNAMKSLLEIISAWTGLPISEYNVNRDFIDVKLDPQALLALLQTWQSGGMSLPSFLYQLERGELLPPDIDADAEEKRIGEGPDFVDLELDTNAA